VRYSCISRSGLPFCLESDHLHHQQQDIPTDTPTHPYILTHTHTQYTHAYTTTCIYNFPPSPCPIAPQVSGKEYDPDLLWYIHGKAYDLTDWVRFHPGGQDALLNAQGRDGTALFESYHFFTDRARNLLAKMTPVEVPPEVGVGGGDGRRWRPCACSRS